MQSPHASRRPAMVFHPFRAFTWGMAASLAGFGSVSAQPPAAKIGAVRSLQYAEPAVIRGGPPEAIPLVSPVPTGYKPSIFDTFEDRAKAQAQFQHQQVYAVPPVIPAPVGYKPSIFDTFEDRAKAQAQSQPSFPSPPDMAQVAAVAPAKPKSSIDSTWQEVVNFFTGAPEPPALQPGLPAGLPATQYPQVIAGPPAYRWYGWGTTTPGANPYAPHGHYPLASANWYAQTGATPGAFPVPAVNPFRPSPGTDPPQYHAGGPPAPLESVPVVIDRPSRPTSTRAKHTEPARLPTPAGRQPTVAVPAFTGYAHEQSPIVQSPVPGFIPLPGTDAPPPGLLPGSAIPTFTPPQAFDVNWEPVSGPISTEPPILTQSGGREQLETGAVVHAVAAEPANLDRQIALACRGLAESVRVKPTGLNRLTIRFVSPTEAHARRAAEEVSKLPALHGYEVAFEAKFGR